MANLSDKRGRKDEFHKRAKSEGYAARAVYKLKEIDDKCQLFRPGQAVLDIGCSPGSWLQYAGERVGPHGTLVGIDRTIPTGAPGRATLHQGDIFDIEPADVLSVPAFDVVLSDMAPDTSGIKHLDQDRSEVLFERALYFAFETLTPGGHFAGKLFQGRGFQEIIKGCRQRFDKVRIVKPKSSRDKSIEQYVVCLDFSA